METFASPLTGGESQLLRTIPASHIRALYRAHYNVDVTPYVPEGPVQLFRYNDTGYEFFTPYSLEGPPEFYATLYGDGDNEDWAYQTVKWEYAAAASFVAEGSRLLDIGSGGGDFLLYIGDKSTPTGLELSPHGLESTRSKGLTAINETIETHAASHSGHYDTVTAFQVLEHVADVHGFVASAVRALAPGGHLIIAVPNNGSFVGAEDDLTLNLPPHHMGRWSRDSLVALAGIFDLDIVSVETEPLQEHNLGWYQSVMESKYLPGSRWKRALFYRLGFHTMFRSFLEQQKDTILGHTIMVVYRKT